MEYWNLIDDTKWEILNNISGGKSTMFEISKAAGTSVANASQQLKLLEAYGIVEKFKEGANGKPGKPTNHYRIGKGFVTMMFLSEKASVRKTFELKLPEQRILVGSIALEKAEDQYSVAKMLIVNEPLLELCDAICFLKSGSEKIELLLITDNLEEVRKEYSNITVKSSSGERKFACWTHSESEIEQGLKNKDPHYTELMKDYIVLYDPKKIVRWKS